VTLVHAARSILRKDIERLWPAITFTLVFLIVWTWQESTRPITAGATPIPQSNWLDFALPFAWSLLIALAIQQDPLTGDREFWPTLPCGWRPLLAAKAAFIAVFVQFPYFLATAAILLARHFNPAQHIPHLFWKQLVLLALILPATAAATVTKNMAQFLLLPIAVASAAVFLSGNSTFANYNDDSWDMRWNLALIVLATGAAAAVLLQFTKRYTVRSRIVAAIFAIAAASAYNYLSRDASAAVYGATHPARATQSAPSVNLASREPDADMLRGYYNYRRATTLIPIDINLASPAHLDQISLELTTASGERFNAHWQTVSNEPGRDRIVTNIISFDSSTVPEC